VENGRNVGWKMERSKGGKWSQRWVENGTIYIKGEIGNFFKIFSQKTSKGGKRYEVFETMGGKWYKVFRTKGGKRSVSYFTTGGKWYEILSKI
jgi:hypothetical protein